MQVFVDYFPSCWSNKGKYYEEHSSTFDSIGPMLRPIIDDLEFDD